jgi:hypothetical protein
VKKISAYIIMAAAGMFLVASCKKQSEYFVDGGGTHNPQVNVTTYDYLKTNPLFDSTLLLIDRAGLKDAVNATDATFFAPTDYSIAAWLTKIRGLILNTYGQDSARKFSLNTFSNAQLRDSLSQYIIPKRVQREDLALTDQAYATALPGDTKIVYLREVNEYIGSVTTKPRYVYLVEVFGDRDIPGVVVPAEETDIEVRCQTSGILTTNGVLHVLNNQHVFGFTK